MPSLQDFIDRGMAFFNGETVSKAEFTALQSQLTEASSKLTLVITERDGLTTKVRTLEGAAQTFATQLAGKDGEITQLKADVAAKDAEIGRLKGEAISVDQAADKKAKELAAAQGIPAAQLPDAAAHGSAATVQQQVDALRAKLATASAEEKFKISGQIKALLEKQRA